MGIDFSRLFRGSHDDEDKTEVKKVATDRYEKWNKMVIPYFTDFNYRTVMRSFSCFADGSYLVLFQTQCVNDSKASGKGVNIEVVAGLKLNGVKKTGWNENGNPERHYICPVILGVYPLVVGDTLEIFVGADSSQPWPDGSVFFINDPEKTTFHVVKIA